jgi:hypothetical protein
LIFVFDTDKSQLADCGDGFQDDAQKQRDSVGGEPQSAFVFDTDKAQLADYSGGSRGAEQDQCD